MLLFFLKAVTVYYKHVTVYYKHVPFVALRLKVIFTLDVIEQPIFQSYVYIYISELHNAIN